MKIYKCFKYSNDTKEYYKSVERKFDVRTKLNKFGDYLIQFDECYNEDDAEEICKIEAQKFSTICFVQLDGDKIFLVDHRKKVVEKS